MNNFSIGHNSNQINSINNHIGTFQLNTLWQAIEECFPPETHERANEHFNNLFSNARLQPNEQLAIFLTLQSLASPSTQSNFRTGYYSGTNTVTCTIDTFRQNGSMCMDIPLIERDYHAEHLNFALNSWVNNAPIGENRNEAADIIQRCFAQNSDNIDLSNQNISSLPTFLPPNLRSLNVANNQLTSLPIFSDSLITLNLSHNQLTSLSSLPEDLERLNIANNQLTNLPRLPLYMISLQANNNQLTNMPMLPYALSDLNVSNNQLTYLQTSQTPLITLDISHNQFTQLPYLPPTLRELYASHNPLVNSPIIPAGLDSDL
ncbi:leucine-rich repeat domain-containing protein [Providencia rettgeri]|uniref:leucine-rich repeat domain-containing protein n=1 Tax=Providencia rettgeri TaxID=587 RepID=UPI001B39579B|nr:leucine-rich repeat domain-containing protein [Providencia rettgeri]MBQ0439549.1 hypothetical protein [Providencia rettgeri]